MAADARRFVPFVLLLGLAGCTATAPVLDDKPDTTLARDEGAFVVERDGGIAWRSITLVARPSGAERSVTLEGTGYATGVFRLPQGRYELVSVTVPAWGLVELTEPIRFTVDPGKLNYLGQFELRVNASHDVWHRVTNRSGRMLTELRVRSPGLVDRWPLVKVGDDADDDWTNTINPNR